MIFQPASSSALFATRADAKIALLVVWGVKAFGRGAPARRPVEARFFEMSGSALLQRRRIEMTYYTRGRRAEGTRTVSP